MCVCLCAMAREIYGTYDADNICEISPKCHQCSPIKISFRSLQEKKNSRDAHKSLIYISFENEKRNEEFWGILSLFNILHRPNHLEQLKTEDIF